MIYNYTYIYTRAGLPMGRAGGAAAAVGVRGALERGRQRPPPPGRRHARPHGNYIIYICVLYIYIYINIRSGRRHNYKYNIYIYIYL